MHVLTNQHIVQNRHALEQTDVLKRSGDSEGNQLVGLSAGKTNSIDTDRARIRRKHSGNHIEQSGLAGSIGADDPVNGISLHNERNILKRLKSAEAFGYSLHDKKPGCRHISFPLHASGLGRRFFISLFPVFPHANDAGQALRHVYNGKNQDHAIDNQTISLKSPQRLR